jgi:hypothetical protein
VTKRHVIEPGEHLAAVTEPAGHLAKTVWQYRENDQLRRARKNPFVLKPGDVVVIPDVRERTEKVATGAAHTFVLERDELRLRFAIYDFDNTPIAGTKVVLEVDGDPVEATTDSKGVVERPVTAAAKAGHLKVPALDLDITLAIGRLEPAAELLGWRARLINLGYYRGKIEDAGPAATKFFAWALEEFQCDFGLKVTGEPDSATIAKLESVHGS